jgi:hypothetical protein
VSALRWPKALWPLLVLLLLAVAVDVALITLGDGWSAPEWASNLLFAFGLTLVTLILGRRQGQLQEASAATDLTEKISVTVGALDAVRAHMRASTVRQLLIDIRAGLYLYPLATPATQHVYRSAVEGVIDGLVDSLDSVRPYTLWATTDWEQISDDTRMLREALKDAVRDDAWLLEMATDLDRLEFNVGKLGVIPLDVFEKTFRRGDLGYRVRVQLNWDLLQQYVEQHMADLTVHRASSHDWMGGRRIIAPWYRRTDGTFALYSEPDVRPMTHNEINDVMDVLPRESTDRIINMQQWLSSTRAEDGGPSVVEIVTLSLNPEETLVLDGNHRLAAIYRTRPGWQEPVAVRIVEYRIGLSMPCGADLLPDLAHHPARDREPEQRSR